jgi:hypothetical protein
MSDSQASPMDIFAPEEAPPDAKEAPVDALIICIERIEALIESENTLLRNCSPFDLERSDLRKARALIELARMSESLPSELSPAAAERLRSFQSKLKENGEFSNIIFARP